MVISELIGKLQKLKEVHGDLPVCTYDDCDDCGCFSNIFDNDIVVDDYAKPDGRFKDCVKSVVIKGL